MALRNVGTVCHPSHRALLKIAADKFSRVGHGNPELSYQVKEFEDDEYAYTSLVVDMVMDDSNPRFPQPRVRGADVEQLSFRGMQKVNGQVDESATSNLKILHGLRECLSLPIFGDDIPDQLPVDIENSFPLNQMWDVFAFRKNLSPTDDVEMYLQPAAIMYFLREHYSKPLPKGYSQLKSTVKNLHDIYYLCEASIKAFRRMDYGLSSKKPQQFRQWIADYNFAPLDAFDVGDMSKTRFGGPRMSAHDCRILALQDLLIATGCLTDALWNKAKLELESIPILTAQQGKKVLGPGMLGVMSLAPTCVEERCFIKRECGSDVILVVPLEAEGELTLKDVSFGYRQDVSTGKVEITYTKPTPEIGLMVLGQKLVVVDTKVDSTIASYFR